MHFSHFYSFKSLHKNTTWLQNENMLSEVLVFFPFRFTHLLHVRQIGWVVPVRTQFESNFFEHIFSGIQILASAGPLSRQLSVLTGRRHSHRSRRRFSSTVCIQLFPGSFYVLQFPQMMSPPLLFMEESVHGL